jgi:hypothetical protein
MTNTPQESQAEPPGIHIIRAITINGITHIYNFKALMPFNLPSANMQKIQISPTLIKHSNIKRVIISALKESML